MEKNEISVKKNNRERNKTIWIIVLSILLISFIIGSAFLVTKLIDYNVLKKNDNIELEYTEPVSVKSDGVYITDVSLVVDKVMPSIVAITSKTVVNSGRFGPFYGNNSYTSEGAGSGVIVSLDDDNIYILTNYHVVQNSSE